MRRTFVDFGLVGAEDVETERVFAFGRNGACLLIVHLQDGKEGTEDLFRHEGVWPTICQWKSLLIVLEKTLRTEQKDFSEGKFQGEGIFLKIQAERKKRLERNLQGRTLQRCTRATSRYLVALPWKWE